MQEIITITPAAEAHIHKVIERRGSGIGLRLSVKKAGCSGYRYQMDIVDDVPNEDQQLVTTTGLKIFIPNDSAEFLQGTQMDFVTKGIGQQQVEFINPNAVSQCGCGESFLTKNDAEQ